MFVVVVLLDPLVESHVVQDAARASDKDQLHRGIVRRHPPVRQQRKDKRNGQDDVDISGEKDGEIEELGSQRNARTRPCAPDFGQEDDEGKEVRHIGDEAEDVHVDVDVVEAFGVGSISMVGGDGRGGIVDAETTNDEGRGVYY